LPGSPCRYVFLSLLPEPASSQTVELLDAALDPASGAAVVAAPVRGLAFFAARGPVARELDLWWSRYVPADTVPVLLAVDEAGLEAHLAGLDSDLVVAVADEVDLQRYAGFSHCHAVVTADPAQLAAHTIAMFGCFRSPAPRVQQPEPSPWAAASPAQSPRGEPGPAYWGQPEQAAPEAQPMAEPEPEAPPEEAPQEPPPTVIFMPRLQQARAPARVAPPQPKERMPAVALSDPFTELSAVGPLGQAAESDRRHDDLSRASLFAVGTSRVSGTRPPRFGLVDRLFVRRRTINIPREIGDLVLGLHPPPLVVVPARKGGVGKTVTAGAVAQVIGYALGDTTGSAAIVDQNIGNPDQWGRLDIPASAGTVRQLMAALSSGLELPPTPAWAKTPALAVYPEDRAAADAYPPGLIQRFVQHLRERHVFLVVDLPNRLPDYTTAEAAICAAYLELADLVILPTTDDPSALLGVLEYLETPSMRGKPVVVSYIVSTDRQLRRHRVVVDLLAEIRQRVVAIEMVPKSEKATLAIVKGMSILDISPKLRDAYIRVTHTAVRTLATAG
jgi:cellulose biosynthesis protein BcsQ